jgi:hypothetical protein
MTAAARKVTRLLGDLETYVSGQSDIIIDNATTRQCEEPISTAITESTVQSLLHRRMNAQQQMRWSPRGTHLMLKVRTSVTNGTLDRDHAVAGCARSAARFGAQSDPQVLDGLLALGGTGDPEVGHVAPRNCDQLITQWLATMRSNHSFNR